MVGVFAADLEFLSRFLGHQGASFRYLSMFCLAYKVKLGKVFANNDGRTMLEEGTLVMLKEGEQRYEETMCKIIPSEREKEREKKYKGVYSQYRGHSNHRY